MTDEREFLVPKITEILSSLCDFSFVFAVNDKIGLCLHLCRDENHGETKYRSHPKNFDSKRS